MSGVQYRGYNPPAFHGIANLTNAVHAFPTYCYSMIVSQLFLEPEGVMKTTNCKLQDLLNRCVGSHAAVSPFHRGDELDVNTHSYILYFGLNEIRSQIL